MILSFKTKKGAVCKVTINYDTATQYELAGTPVTLEEDDDEDFFAPVRTWSGYIHMIDVDMALPIALTNTRREVTIEVDDVVVFSGWTKKENYTGQLGGALIDYDIPIECCLSRMKAMDVEITDDENMTIQSMLTEALDKAFGAGGYSLHIDDDAFPIQTTYIERALWCAKWDPVENHPEDVKTYFDVMCDIMQAYGMTMYVRGRDVYCTKRYHAYESEALSGVELIGSNNQWQINAPKKKVKVEGGAPVPDFPEFNLGSFNMDPKYGSNAYDGGDSWVRSRPCDNPDAVETFRSDGSGVSINLPKKYFADKSFVGGAVFCKESEFSKNNAEADTGNGTNAIVLSRTMTSAKGRPVASTINSPMLKWNPKLPIRVSPGYYQVTGTTSGMWDYYKWNHNGGGYLICVIRVGNLYMQNNDYGTTVWASRRNYVSIPIGNDGEVKTVDGEAGQIGCVDGGWFFNCPYIGEMEIWILGFSPKDDNVVFLKIEDMCIKPKEYEDAKDETHTYDSNSDAEDTYEVTMNLLQSKQSGRRMGVYYTTEVENAVRMWQKHFSETEMMMKMRVDSSVAHGLTDAYSVNGKTMVVRAVEMDLKEDEVVMSLSSVNYKTSI